MDFDTFFIEEDDSLKIINELKSMSIEEYTLKVKWYEIQKNLDIVTKFSVDKTKIFNPQSVEEIENIKIKIISTDIDEEIYRTYKRFMIFTSSALQNNYPGKKLTFIVIDETTEKYLGMICIAGDIGAVSGRDNLIGWTNKHKYDEKRINNLYNAQVLVPTQPFGFNCLGGKLFARIVLTDFFRNIWKKEYESVAVGVTTTSMYGKFCQYTGLKAWQNVGTTSGRVPIELPENTLNKWKAKYPNLRPEKSLDNKVVRDRSKDLLSKLICKDLGISPKSLYHGIKRGVFFAPLYKNSNDFLQGKITENELQLIPDINNINLQVNLWKNSAIKRFISLQKDARLKQKAIYYDIAVGKSFNETKKLFLNDVNR